MDGALTVGARHLYPQGARSPEGGDRSQTLLKEMASQGPWSVLCLGEKHRGHRAHQAGD